MKRPLKPRELERLLTTKEAATLLSISPNTLKFWRVKGHRVGPVFIRLGGSGGRVRYSLRDLMAYVRKQSVRLPKSVRAEEE